MKVYVLTEYGDNAYLDPRDVKTLGVFRTLQDAEKEVNELERKMCDLEETRYRIEEFEVLG